MRTYESTFRNEAVKLAEEIGAIKASKELNIPRGTLDTWMSKAKKGMLRMEEVCQRRALTMADEIKRLQQENKELKRTNKILSKAAAFFAQSRKK